MKNIPKIYGVNYGKDFCPKTVNNLENFCYHYLRIWPPKILKNSQKNLGVKNVIIQVLDLATSKNICKANATMITKW